MPAHIHGSNRLPITKTYRLNSSTELFIFMFRPSSFRTESGRFGRASRLRGLGRLVVDGLLLLCSLLFFGRGFSIDVGHLRVRWRRRLEHGHGARRQHTAGREHLGARRRVEAEEHSGARARGLPPSHVGQNCPRGLPRGAAGLRGWGRPGRAFNLNLREASRRRAAPGRAGIWAPAAPPVVQSRRRRQLLRPGARLLSYVCSGREVSGDAWRARLGVFSDQPHGDLSGGLARISPGRRAVDCLRGLSREQAPSRGTSDRSSDLKTLALVTSFAKW